MLAFFAPIMFSGMALPEADVGFLSKHMPKWGQDVTILFLVSPEGDVVSCEFLYPERTSHRHDKVCNKIIGLRFGDAATTRSGEAVYGLATGTVASWKDGRRPNRPTYVSPSPRLQLSVAGMPNDEKFAMVSALVMVDHTGKIADCEPSPMYDTMLSKVACAQLVGFDAGKQMDANGNGVPYITQMVVEFVLDEND